MTSQWMLFNVNPEWPTDENYHWQAFIKDANLRFLAGENIYRSPYMLEYWSMKHGLTIIGDLFRAGKRGEDPASTYMKMFNLSTEDFAKEAVDCYSRLLTFDFPGKHEMNKKYAGEFLRRHLHQFAKLRMKSRFTKHMKIDIFRIGTYRKKYRRKFFRRHKLFLSLRRLTKTAFEITDICQLYVNFFESQLFSIMDYIPKYLYYSENAIPLYTGTYNRKKP